MNAPTIEAASGGVADVAREIARGGLAGVLTGLMMGGVGGRIAMRISALVDPSALGRTTEGGATVGEFTLEGTIGLIVFGGLFTGLGLGVIWVIVRRWLPPRGAPRYLGAAVVGVAVGGRFAIDGRNIDFLILDPKLVQVAIFLTLAAVTGVAVVPMDNWLERRLPPASGGVVTIYTGMAVLGAVLTMPLIVSFFSRENCACVSPARLPGLILIAVALLTAAAWISAEDGTATPRKLNRWGQIALGALCITGLLHLGGEIAHFV